MGNQSKMTGALLNARAAAVLTTAAVAAATLPVQNTPEGTIMVDVDFTLGSLTSATFTPQVSDDGVNWRTLSDPGALGPLTATGSYSFPCICKGKKYFRVTAIGVGTVTGSSATISYRWQAAGGTAF